MKWIVVMFACFPLLAAAGCEDRDRGADNLDEPAYRDSGPETSPADAPERKEGPAERAGRAVDRATKKAAEAVGRGLEEAGKEIQEHVPDSRPD